MKVGAAHPHRDVDEELHDDFNRLDEEEMKHSCDDSELAHKGEKDDKREWKTNPRQPFPGRFP